MTEIVKNLNRVREQIQQLARHYRREPDGISLLAVSKTKPVADIRAAYAAGQRDFGENYLQEAQEKQKQLSDLAICWHFIGRVQGNKTAAIAEHFDWVHGVCELKHARRLSQQRPESLPPLNCCLQVNLSGEASKGGVEPARLDELAQEVATLANLRLRGLMVLPAAQQDLAAQRQPFRQLAEMKQDLNAHGLSLDTLSMGMSGDLEAAIAEGATIVRVGTAIFGTRAKPMPTMG